MQKSTQRSTSSRKRQIAITSRIHQGNSNPPGASVMFSAAAKPAQVIHLHFTLLIHFYHFASYKMVRTFPLDF